MLIALSVCLPAGAVLGMVASRYSRFAVGDPDRLASLTLAITLGALGLAAVVLTGVAMIDWLWR